MSLAPTPTIYFNGIDYNPLFYQKPSGISLTYASQNYLSRIGPNPTSVATKTSFSGNLEITNTTLASAVLNGSGSITTLGGIYCAKNIQIGNSSSPNSAVLITNAPIIAKSYPFIELNYSIGSIQTKNGGAIVCTGNINTGQNIGVLQNSYVYGNSYVEKNGNIIGNLSVSGETILYDGGVNNNFAISAIVSVGGSVIIGNQITAPKIVCNSLKSYGEIDYLNKIGAFLNLTFFPYTLPISSCIDDITICYGTLYLERLLTIDCSVTLQPHYKIVFLTNLNYVLSIIDNTEGEKPYYQTLPYPNYYSNYNQCFKIYLYYNNIRIY